MNTKVAKKVIQKSKVEQISTLINKLVNVAPEIGSSLVAAAAKAIPENYSPFANFKTEKIGLTNAERSIIPYKLGEFKHFVLDYETENIIIAESIKAGLTTDEVIRRVLWRYCEDLSINNFK